VKRRAAKARTPSLSLIGAGAVGSTLASLLAKEGYRIRSVISRNGPAAVDLARAVSCPRASTEIADLDRTADIILIAVRDADLGGVVRSLAAIRGLKLKNRTILHTSGVHSASVLSPLRKTGASLASFHPLQTFPSPGGPARTRAGVRGICFGIDGDDEGVKVASRVAADLGAKPLRVPPEMRPLYHAAGVFASGYLAVVLSAVSTLSRSAGLALPWTEIFGPLMTATMENTVRTSAADALTGPVVRGDLDTVGAHLRALEQFAPDLVPLYTVAALEVARIAVGRGRLPQNTFDELLAALRASVRGRKRTAGK
jgi:predicted short-subunit dehydrogenase-like oxidoreductase (DUF2520 family)